METLSQSQFGGCRALSAPPAVPAGARPAPGSPGSGRPQHGLPGCPRCEPWEREPCAGLVTVLEFLAADGPPRLICERQDPAGAAALGWWLVGSRPPRFLDQEALRGA